MRLFMLAEHVRSIHVLVEVSHGMVTSLASSGYTLLEYKGYEVQTGHEAPQRRREDVILFDAVGDNLGSSRDEQPRTSYE